MILVALPSTHPLVKKPKIKLADLAPLFFVGMSVKTHPGTREWLLDLCQNAGFAGKILQEADVEPTALKFVAGGSGWRCCLSRSWSCRTKASSSGPSRRPCGASRPLRGVCGQSFTSRSRITSRS